MKTPIIASPSVTRHILTKYKLIAKKKLGQNFLIDPSVVEKIAAAAELTPNDRVLEIGPGIGTLTQGLAESGADVVAVELDQRLIPVLGNTLADYPNIKVVQGDILEMDIPKIIASPFKCCANLPYYITTPIIFALLEQNLEWERLVFMVQKEVAERIVAEPGGKDYGALSVTMQYYTEPQIAFTVPPSSFIPAPNVESAVLVCKKREKSPVELKSLEVFFKVVETAFSVRRKMLHNSLKNYEKFDNSQVEAWLERAGIDGNRRAETLSLEEFARLANAVE